MRTYVIDTSVVVKWFSRSNEGDLEKALMLRKLHLQRECRLISCDLLFYELGNSLRHNPNLSKEDVVDAEKSILKMRIEMIRPTEEIVESSVSISYQYDITFYDACFIAQAKLLSCELITADMKCSKKVSGLEWIVPLSKWNI
ncbi:type II toxin-antitoxin system VapC family toxin [bacterium]|nr:type II toxin-antitoxin system VapC family toxin [bacterium]MBU1600066.1 type II toxin-antitoxin system VapC family toxin [bacterium]MBU2462424.1 type II toxin-antitoxin system VapC family toxin [bacterium]